MADLNLPTAPSARQPRGVVKLAGVIVPGWIAWEVENNVFRAADTFRVGFAVASLPVARDAAWFAIQTEITVEIFASDRPTDPGAYVPAAGDRVIYGQVDDIDYHPALGTIELTGRDLTSRLIDTRTSVNNSNQTASQIASIIAGQHGLKPVVTATTTRVGTYYANDHVDVSQQQSEWEILIKLADYEGFDVFVTGDELHFEPKPPEGSSHYALVWTPPTPDTAHPSLNATTIALSRSLTIAKGVSVEVRSWNAKQKKAFTAAWPRQVKQVKPGASTNENQTYRFSIPGLTQDQAQARAQKLYAQIVQHMVKLSADLPGDGLLDCTKTISLRGTGTAFDQVYFPDSVRRSMSMDEGYRMSVTAKNISQDIEAAAGTA
jgi:phage protein D